MSEEWAREASVIALRVLPRLPKRFGTAKASLERYP